MPRSVRDPTGDVCLADGARRGCGRRAALAFQRVCYAGADVVETTDLTGSWGFGLGGAAGRAVAFTRSRGHHGPGDFSSGARGILPVRTRRDSDRRVLALGIPRKLQPH